MCVSFAANAKIWIGLQKIKDQIMWYDNVPFDPSTLNIKTTFKHEGDACGVIEYTGGSFVLSLESCTSLFYVACAEVHGTLTFSFFLVV